MKYIEELKSGEAFTINSDIYLLTTDFKKNGDKLAVNTKTGFLRWFDLSTIIEETDIYFISDGNFSPINPRQKNVDY
jgi:hypothetical protein